MKISTMLLFMIPVLFLSSGVNSLDSFQGQKRSAASDAQIRFAIENKYDQTGPGANGREYAYNTYKNLDEALVGYLDDPDTKLPEYEKAKATAKLYDHPSVFQKLNQRPLFLSGAHPEKISLFNQANIDIQAKLPHDFNENNLGFLKNFEKEKPKLDPFRFHKVMSVKGSPLNLAHFTRDPQEITQDFNPNPHYTFSYGVHDKRTGDSKAAQESRTGGTVHGFYSFLDADGKQRTVQYTADDDQGFRAIVRRTAANAQ